MNSRPDEIVESYLAGSLDSKSFASLFETGFNFGDWSRSERDSYQGIFDLVVRFSPFPAEVEAIHFYVGEEELREKVTFMFAEIAENMRG